MYMGVCFWKCVCICDGLVVIFIVLKGSEFLFQMTSDSEFNIEIEVNLYVWGKGPKTSTKILWQLLIGLCRYLAFSELFDYMICRVSQILILLFESVENYPLKIKHWTYAKKLIYYSN